ncbi:hypothetical protein ACFW6E_12235 [Streptomyces olivaceoviridis]|uniref:hypothetical protein n=1 Tax=Streptomyces olivaceoviridis TaxID=1921 RepID=UPI00368985A3
MDTGPRGLTDAEAAARLTTLGENTPPRPHTSFPSSPPPTYGCPCAHWLTTRRASSRADRTARRPGRPGPVPLSPVHRDLLVQALIMLALALRAAKGRHDRRGR